MVKRELIAEILTKSINDVQVKCGKKQLLARFYKNKDNYYTEDVSLEPIELGLGLDDITDEEKIMDWKNITKDPYKDSNGNPILYGALENRQNEKQKIVKYSPEEFGGVNNYSATEYNLINGKIYGTEYYKRRRKDAGQNIEDWVNMRIRQIDSAIRFSPTLLQDTVLFRYGNFPSDLKAGDSGKFKGYISTSYQEETAERFKDGYDGKSEGRYKLKIYAPAGTKGVLLNEQFETVKEHEFLLGRNQKYIVLNVDDNTKEAEILLYDWD